MQIVAADIGGTNARFAIAELADGRVASLSEPVTIRTADHTSLSTAWEAFGVQLGRPTPTCAAIAVAAPVEGDTLKLTNNPWVIRPASLAHELGLETMILLNDFVAVGHTVAHVGEEMLEPVCGPAGPLPAAGLITVLGPGTGLGVTHVLREGRRTLVTHTEGGHVDFAPVDSVEDAIMKRLRGRFRRVSAERVVSGPGLANIYECLAVLEGRPVVHQGDAALWTAAIEGADSLAAAALDRLCLSLGSVAGDLALAQGAKAVVLAGDLARRIRSRLASPGFRDRFVAKGRFEGMMSQIPVRRLEHPQPGLYGAAAAFAGTSGARTSGARTSGARTSGARTSGE